jgi:hypothetical protein
MLTAPASRRALLPMSVVVVPEMVRFELVWPLVPSPPVSTDTFEVAAVLMSALTLSAPIGDGTLGPPYAVIWARAPTAALVVSVTLAVASALEIGMTASLLPSEVSVTELDVVASSEKLLPALMTALESTDAVLMLVRVMSDFEMPSVTPP